MRFHGLLEDLLANRTAIRVLRVLLRHPAKEFTGRELAETAGAAPPNTIRELKRLYRHGVLDRRRVGPAEAWRWRADHVLTDPLRDLVDLEEACERSLRSSLRDGLAAVRGVERVVLFGSVARGDEEPDSDVDLLVVVRDEATRDRAMDALDDLRVEVAQRFGNRVSAVVYTVEELREKADTPLVRAATRDGIDLLEDAAVAGGTA